MGRRARGTCSGRETSHPRLLSTSRSLPRRTSRGTWGQSSTTSTRPPTSCSETCPRGITRSAPSTGLLPRPLRTLIEEGKGDLQWERDIPPAALANLEELAKKDFKGNLGTIIHDIYQTAHLMFGDMPQGDHKKRAKYRFASKTLMRLLPKELLSQVEGLIEKKTITLDLYDILGQCTWGQK